MAKKQMANRTKSIEIKRMELEADYQKNRLKLNLQYKAFSLCSVVFIAYIIKEGVVQVAQHSPEQITATGGAIEKIIKATSVNVLLPWGLFILAICVILFYRWRTRRLIRQLSDAREIIESNDPNRTSSGLTKDGETPKER